jgi:hypothetical protein
MAINSTERLTSMGMAIPSLSFFINEDTPIPSTPNSFFQFIENTAETSIVVRYSITVQRMSF